MNTKTYSRKRAVAVCVISLGVVASSASGQSTDKDGNISQTKRSTVPAGTAEALAERHVTAATAVAGRMVSDPRLTELLQHAKGVFIVPAFGRAALGIGASGGAGILLTKDDNATWSEPIFYTLGGMSAGVQAGAQSGVIALILNNENAVAKFAQKNSFSLSADAGLTIIDWSKMAHGSVGVGDVVVWAEAKGFYGNLASIGINDIRFNEKLTDAYYHLNLSPKDVMTGRVKNPQANQLRQALGLASPEQKSGQSTSGSQDSGPGQEKH